MIIDVKKLFVNNKEIFHSYHLKYSQWLIFFKFFYFVISVWFFILLSCGTGDIIYSCKKSEDCRNDNICIREPTTDDKYFCYFSCITGENCKENQECIVLDTISKKEKKKVCYECSSILSNRCTFLGAFYMNTSEFPADYTKAKKYLEKACDWSDGDGCGFLAILYRDGLGIEKNIEKEKYFYEKGCELKSPYSCNLLGLFYEKLHEYKKAIEYYEKSCNLSANCNWHFCRLSAASSCSSLGNLYEKNSIIEKNCEKANFYYKKSCEISQLQFMACTSTTCK